MALINEFQDLLSEFRSNEDYIKRNTALYEVNEGNILPHILNALSKQFSNNTFEQMTHRVPPINVLKRVVDKLSRIYQPGPTRSIVNGQDSDDELFEWYNESMDTNNKMNLSNEYFNLFKNDLFHICLIDGVPTLRPYPSDRFFVFGKDPLNPMKVTHVLTCQGQTRHINKPKDTCLLYYLYTDTEFLIVQDDDIIRTDLMAAYGNPEGINPFNKLPFVYISRSANELIPMPDSDMYAMSLIIPQNFTDLNAGVMFQIFSIFYGIGVSPEGLVYAPNAFWQFKVDPGQEGKAEVGILKPQIDVDQALSLIQAQLTLWLQSIGVRPGAIGQLSGGDNFASGISKIIDEMDTAEHRMKQISFYQRAEQEMWNFIINYGHPYWVASGQIENSLVFTPGVKVSVNFAEQIPLQTRDELVKEQILEIQAGLTTKRRAIQKLNPDMTDSEIDQLIEEIDAEKALTITVDNNNGQQAQAETQAQSSQNQIQQQAKE